MKTQKLKIQRTDKKSRQTKTISLNYLESVRRLWWTALSSYEILELLKDNVVLDTPYAEYRKENQDE